ncbi:Transporter, putative (fragment) [Shewanella benthica]|uniref:Transporter, putative n=1 Tax=Shewanella benthica TaxID=43661 RepID=A0A330LXM4_9GAMM
MLQSLPASPNQDKLQTKIQMRLLTSQHDLITQLWQSQDFYLSELTDLRVIYEQLTQQNIALKSILHEHLFGLPNANSIDKLWITDLFQSVKWLMSQTFWPDISVSFDEQSEYWSWWIILLVLCLVTQDLFSYSFRTLINSLLYLLYRFTYLLALNRGLLIGYFKGEKTMIRQGGIRFKSSIIMVIHLFSVMGFTEFINNSVLRYSIGRGAFIIFSIFLFRFYKDILSLSKKNKHRHQDDKNYCKDFYGQYC